MTDGTGVPLDADYFNRIETAVGSMNIGVASAVSITYASIITPNAAEGQLFRCDVTGDLALNAPASGTVWILTDAS